MVITPTLRGLFGISIDAQTKTITVNPHLPASWDHAEVLHLPVKDGDLSLTFNKEADHWQVLLGGTSVSAWRIRTNTPGTSSNTRVPEVRVPIPPVQLDEAAEVPEPGSRTLHARVLHEERRANGATLVFEGPAGSSAVYNVVGIDLAPHLKIDSPENMGISPRDFDHLAAYVLPCKPPCRSTFMDLHFPEGQGWKTITVTLTW
jgi:hypothetical protein